MTSTARRVPVLLAALSVVAGVMLAVPRAAEAADVVVTPVPATAETEPVAHSGDAADDPAIWVDPADPARSLVIGNDKGGALETYDLSGARVQRIVTSGRWGNVDVRQDVGIPTAPADIVAVMNGGLRVYSVDRTTRELVEADEGKVATGGEGLCLYRGPSGLYVFVVLQSGQVNQFALTDDDGDGRLAAALVRTFQVGSEAEGCFADDATGALYVAQETVALWRYGAEPDAGTARVAVDTVTGSGGRLAPEIEGVTGVRRADGTGILIASAQNVAHRSESYFAVYDLDSNAYIRSFRVVDGATADDCDGTDGIAAHAGPLGEQYPDGLFVCQDNNNDAPGTNGNQNFKYASLATALAPPDGPLPPDPPQPPQPPVDPPQADASFVAASTADGNSATGRITVPAQVRVGDTLLLFASTGAGPITAPPGWSAVATRSTSPLETGLYVRTATAADAGATLTVPFAALSKYALTVAAYRGIDTADPVAALAASTESAGTSRLTPSATTTTPAWVVSHWAVRSSSVTAWSGPSRGSSRATVLGSGGGRISTLLADSGAVLGAGTVGAITAGTDTSASRATLWTVALRPQAGDGGGGTDPLPPTARASVNCEQLQCRVDGTASSDPDGDIVSYAWDFGDGNSGSGASTTHTYAEAGRYSITLTVTDATGLTSAASQPVTLTAGGGDPVPAAGTPYAWGGNGYGQLGDGATTSRLSAGPVRGLTDVVAMHGGRDHAVALSSSGTVYTWGRNQVGQLGLGGGASRTVPTAVPGLPRVTAVTTGHNMTYALDVTGQVWAWGDNASGQLGDGTRTQRTSPVKVSGMGDAVAIAAGRDMAYAIRADGTVWAWGLNNDGQLGDGTTTLRTTPVRVTGLTGATAIAGGRDHALALRADGSLWAWGWNAYGQVGDGSTTNRSAPVQVASGMTAVAAGAHHSYALRADGQVMAWGRNYRAELGDGSTTGRSTPVAVRGVNDAIAIGSGRDQGLAVLRDGSVKAWGYNQSGQLGDGTTVNRTTAVSVPGVSGATAVAGGAEYSMALVGGAVPPPPPPPPGNEPPTARLTVGCDGLTCTADGSASSDPDGSIASYAWDFGDGTRAGGRTAGHTYATAGTYQVSLTVTDDAGASDSARQQVTVTAPPPTGTTIAFVGQSSSDAHTRSAQVMVPVAVRAGDGLVLVASVASSTVQTQPPPGWTAVGDATTDPLATRVYRRTATAADAGSPVTVALDGLSKISLQLVAYRGVAVDDFVTARFVTAGGGTAREAPAVEVADAGSWVIGYWADRSSSDRTWSAPAGSTVRGTTYGTGGGRVTSLLVDSGGPVAAGAYPARTATTSASGSRAVAATLVLRPAT